MDTHWYPRTCRWRRGHGGHGDRACRDGFYNVTRTFESHDALESYLGDKMYGSDPKKPQLLLDIHFDRIPGHGELGAKVRSLPQTTPTNARPVCASLFSLVGIESMLCLYGCVYNSSATYNHA